MKPQSLTCSHCGLPMSVRRVEPGRPCYCCSGCAFLARLPAAGSDQFPVTPALLAGLGAGFVVFNQLLFWLGAFLLRREAGRELLASNLALTSIVCGGVLAVLLAVTQWKSGASRLADFFVLAGAGALLGFALAHRAPVWAVTASALLLAWSGRGMLRKKRRAA
ncbi:hypothetical protein Ga0100231_021620 [Opitutaceae bacterium TAV4]|nr:hypothetical protein Ga0100231_021620 [Opitutaceae bacterium TAV4]RRJ99798.1 hypothetical protein Ga0100230_017240 [Opitutaceae bacterium TAV3]